MSVYMLAKVNDDIHSIAGIARICVTPFNKSFYKECYKDREHDIKTVTNLYKRGHWSVFEHVHYTYIVECSRACSLQLARHRHISRTEMSQRYTRFDDYREKYFEFPPMFESQHEEMQLCFEKAIAGYRRLLASGVPPEDARFVLPEGIKTRMIITLNLRTLLELTQKRANNTGAQWEIRALIRDMWVDVDSDLKNIFKDELLWINDVRSNPVD